MGQIAPESPIMQKGGLLSGLRKSISAAARKVVKKIQTLKLPTIRKAPVGSQPPVKSRTLKTNSGGPAAAPAPAPKPKSQKALDELKRREAVRAQKLEKRQTQSEIDRAKFQAIQRTTPAKTMKAKPTPAQKASIAKRQQAGKLIQIISQTAKKKATIAKALGISKWTIVKRIKKIGAALKANVKLSKINNDRAGRRIVSNQKQANDAATTNAKSHGQHLESYIRSKNDTTRPDPPNTPVKDMDTVNSRITAETNMATSIFGRRRQAATERDGALAEGRRADGEITRAANNMKTTKEQIGGTDGRGGLLGAIGNIVRMIGDKIGSIGGKRKNAADSKANADIAGRNAAAAKRSGENMEAPSSAKNTRDSNANSAAAYNTAARDAGVRKTTAENAVKKIQEERQISVARDLTDANVRVTKSDADLKSNIAARDGPGGVKDRYAAARKRTSDKQTEFDNNGVDAKRQETADALRENAAANTAHNQNTSNVATARRDLNNEMTVVEPSLRKTRTDAEAELSAMTPARSKGEPADMRRRDAIPEEIKPFERRRNAANDTIDTFTAGRDVGPTSLKGKRGINNEEIKKLSDDMRDKLTPTDTGLKLRAKTLGDALVKPKADSAVLGPDINGGKTAVSDLRKHADEVAAFINLKGGSPVLTRPADTLVDLTGKQGAATRLGESSATAHGSALGARNLLNTEVGVRNQRVTSEFGLLGSKKGDFDTATGRLDAETNMATSIFNRRRQAGTDREVGLAEGRRADGEITGAASSMKTTRERIGGTDGRGGLLGGINSNARMIGDKMGSIGGKRKNAADSKANADIDGRNAAAAKANGENNTTIDGINASRRGAVDEVTANRKSIADATKRKADAEAEAARIDAAAKREAAAIKDAQDAVARARAEADAARRSLGDAEADVTRIRNESDAAWVAGRRAKELADADIELANANRKVEQGKKDLADCNENLSRLKKNADELAAKKRGAENDRDANEAAINQKRREKDDNGMDIDDSNTNNFRDRDDIDTARRDLDTEMLNEGRLRKNRDDAADDMNAQRPREDPEYANMRKRQKDIDEEIKRREGESQRGRRDAEDGDVNVDTLRRRKQPPDDPDPNTKLRDENDANRRRREEEERRRRDNEGRRRDTDEDMNSNMLRRMMLATMLTTVMNQIFLRILQTPPPSAPTPPVVVWPPPASGPQAPEFSGPTDNAGSGAVRPHASGPTTPPMASMPNIPDLFPQFNLPSGAFTVPVSGPISMSEYDKGLQDGALNGRNDGKIDGTADGMKVGVGLDEDIEGEIIDEMMKENEKIDSLIESNIKRLEQNAYCAQVETAGIAKKINVRRKFPECNDYFTLMNTPDMVEYGEADAEYGEKGSAYGEAGSEYGEVPPVEPSLPSTEAGNAIPEATEGEEEAEGETEAEAEEEAEAEADAEVEEQEGGYRENANGVMQYGGAYNIAIAEPETPYDIGYAKAYKEAYQSAYNLAFTLTKMALLTGIVNKRLNTNSIEYGEADAEYGEAETAYGSAETEYGEVAPNAPEPEAQEGENAAEPEAQEGENAAEPEEQEGENAPEPEAQEGENAAEPEEQEGGYLKKLKRARRSKGLNRGGARLLKRIANKTTGQ